MNGSATGECQPGVHEVCACPGNNSGVQRCRADRTYEACMCPMVDSLEPSSDGDAASGPAAGGAGMSGPTKTGGSGGRASPAVSSGGSIMAGVGGSGASAGTGGFNAAAGTDNSATTAGSGGFAETAGEGGAVGDAGSGGVGGSDDDSPALAACTKVCDVGVGLMCKFMDSCVSSCLQVAGWTEYPADYQAMLDCWAAQLNTEQYECFVPGDFLITAPVKGTSCEAVSCKWACEDASYCSVRVYNRCGCQ